MIDTQLNALLELQTLDLTLLQLKREAGSLPERKERLAARTERAKGRLEAAQDGLRAREAEIKSQDMASEELRQRITRYRNQQMEVKSNDAYKALEQEIAICGREIANVEDAELELMETLEGLKGEVEEAKRELADAEEAVKEESGVLDARLEVIKEQFGELKEKREGILEGVDADILKKYHGHLASKRDAFLVPVRQQSCGGCHMKLNPQTLHDIHAMARWTFCGHCGRALYDPQELGAV